MDLEAVRRSLSSVWDRSDSVTPYMKCACDRRDGLIRDESVYDLLSNAERQQLTLWRFALIRRIAYRLITLHPDHMTCYAMSLCFRDAWFGSRVKRMGGDSNPRCLSAHTLSRRAQ